MTAAKPQKLAFTFDGKPYEIAPSEEWDLDAMEAYEEGRVLSCVKMIIGEEQFLQFKPKGAKRTVGDLNGLFEAIQKAAGFTGN